MSIDACAFELTLFKYFVNINAKLVLLIYYIKVSPLHEKFTATIITYPDELYTPIFKTCLQTIKLDQYNAPQKNSKYFLQNSFSHLFL